MDCVNHAGTPATAYCQNCGKPLCTDCITAGAMHPASRGMILCNSCIEAWQTAHPFVAPPPGTPSPGLAAVIGLIPGVGAMYNGQFVKGLIHVVIFAVLISAAHLYGVFGVFIAAGIAYQSFEAYHTARARRDGTPIPDPLGLNELGAVFNFAPSQRAQQQPPFQGTVPPASTTVPPADSSASGPTPSGQQTPFTPPYQAPFGGPYTPPYTPPFTPPGPGYPPAGMPPVPPVPPPGGCWGRREPIGAIVLIVLGVLFALGNMDFFSFHIFHYSWPILLIGLGVWLIVRRIGDLKGDK